MYSDIKQAAYEANMLIPANNLALYTWGNVSAFDKDKGVFAIKPSGVPYPELTPDSMVIVDVDGNKVEGKLNPSSDTPTHAVLYKVFGLEQNAEIGGIIHTHSTFAVSWAQAVKSVPLYGTTHADHLQKDIPCTPYLSKEAVQKAYELETGLQIIKYFEEKGLNPSEVNMVLCGGHGPFAWGKNADKAVYNGTVLEEICKMATFTRLNGASMEDRLPDYIINKHYERKHGPNSYYGQGK
ncbi:MAG: L-ribulose-5-phosphate 4-epimerase AraD [Treponema sp.]|nr:L-ribulose-5-phosphate 4-epimerase AraD [Treponema sp.]